MYKSVQREEKKGGKVERSRRLYHSNSNADFLLGDFSFVMTREQK